MYHPTTRVLTLLELLQTHGNLSGPALAARLEVDIRTVRRYITILQDLGIPVEAERGRYGTYRLRPGFKLPPLLFSEDEAVAITLGLLAARRMGLAVGAPAVAGALAKVERVAPAAVRERVQAVQQTLIFAVRPPEAPPAGEIVVTLSQAAQQQRRVQIAYTAWDGTASERTLDPYGLVYHDGRWYTVGHCGLRDELRVFRVDRVRQATLGEMHFTRPPDFDPLRYVLDSLAAKPGNWPVEVLLHASLEELQEHVSPAVAALEPVDAGVVLRCEARNLDWMARYIVSLGCPFVVRRPAELHAALHALAQRILTYADDNGAVTPAASHHGGPPEQLREVARSKAHPLSGIMGRAGQE